MNGPRAAYDTVARSYATFLTDALASMPMDRALLSVFAERVGDGVVADLGCGTGRLTGHLSGLGLDVFGVDLSLGMLQQAPPELDLVQGSLSRLPVASGTLAGALAWYSLIHTAPADLPAVAAELRRVLRPDGELLVAFQAGDDERVHRTEAYGHRVDLFSYRLDPATMVAALQRAGLTVHTKVFREPEGPYERGSQAYLMARAVSR